MDSTVKGALESPEFPSGACRKVAMAALAPLGEGILAAVEAALAEIVPKIQSEAWDTKRGAIAKASALRLVQARILADAKRPLSAEVKRALSGELDTYYDHDFEVLVDVLERLDLETREEIFRGTPPVRMKDYRNLVRASYLAPGMLPGLIAATAPLECGKYEDRYISQYAVAIAAFGPGAAESILAAIPGAKNDGATALARSLETIARPSHAPQLVDLLGHGVKGVRLAAAAALQRLGAEAKGALETGAKSKKKAIREVASELLASLSVEKSRADELLAQAAALPDREEIVALFEAGKEDPGAAAKLAERGTIVLACAHDWLKDRAEDYRARSVYHRVLTARREDPDTAWLAAKLFSALPKISTYSYREFINHMRTMGANVTKPIVSVLKGPAFPLRAPLFELLVEIDRKADVELFVDALSDSSKEIRGYAVECLGEMGAEIGPKLVPLLAAKSADTRLATAQVIAQVKATGAVEALGAALSAEKKPDVAAALERAIAACGGATAEADPASDTEESTLAALAKERKAKLPKWLDLGKLPALVTKSGRRVEGDSLHGLITRLMNEGPEALDAMARRVRPFLDDASGCAFSVALKDVWASNRGDSKHKWAIYQQAILVDDERLDAVAPRLDDMTSGGNHHLAGWYVDVLARHSAIASSNRGLSWVAYWAKAADTRALKEKASAALAAAAESRGKSASELEPELNAYVADDVADANVPILEKQTLDFGPRKFTLSVSRHLEPVLETEDGDVVPKLPAPNKKDDAEKAKEAKETFSRFKKQLAAVARDQVQRMESAMVSARPWSKPAFERLFLGHPTMKLLGTRLVFTDGQTMFRPTEGALLSSDLAPVTLADDAQIRIAHRMDMTDAQAQAWGQQLGDAEIIQPFDQLGRTIHRKTAAIAPPDGKLAPATLSGRLRGNGWRHVSVEDAGMCYEAYRAFPGRRTRACLSHEGVHVSDPSWSNDEVGIQQVWFTDLSGAKLDVGSVDPIVFSEVVRDIERIVER